MEEADLIKERLLAITDKRRVQEDIAKKRRQIDEEKLKVQYIKKKALREQWLMDGLSQQTEEELEAMKAQAQEDQEQTVLLLSNINRIEKEVDELETQELNISANEETILKRLKEVERTTEDIIKELKAEFDADPIQYICSPKHNVASPYKPKPCKKLYKQEDEDEPKKALFAMEISVERDLRTGESQVVATTTVSPQEFHERGVKVFDDGRKSVYALHPSEGRGSITPTAPTRSSNGECGGSGVVVEELTPVEVEEMLRQATDGKVPSEVQYHPAVYSSPYTSSSSRPSTPRRGDQERGERPPRDSPGPQGARNHVRTAGQTPGSPVTERLATGGGMRDDLGPWRSPTPSQTPNRFIEASQEDRALGSPAQQETETATRTMSQTPTPCSFIKASPLCQPTVSPRLQGDKVPSKASSPSPVQKEPVPRDGAQSRGEEKQTSPGPRGGHTPSHGLFQTHVLPRDGAPHLGEEPYMSPVLRHIPTDKRQPTPLSASGSTRVSLANGRAADPDSLSPPALVSVTSRSEGTPSPIHSFYRSAASYSPMPSSASRKHGDGHSAGGSPAPPMELNADHLLRQSPFYLDRESALNLVNRLPDQTGDPSEPVTMIFMGYQTAEDYDEEEEDIQAELIVIGDEDDDGGGSDGCLAFHPEGYRSRVFQPQVGVATVVCPGGLTEKAHHHTHCDSPPPHKPTFSYKPSDRSALKL